MGVTGLWTVVAPTARPTQLAMLNRKRLAVDASIWIYQFLKAVRDKEGNALRNSHVVGFFRRICKLLYFGIKPVFVFDGGAPLLKRETIRSRARRREGRREDAARTAGKLLAVQMARAADEEEKRLRAERERTPVEAELPADQDLIYVDEIGMTQKERQVGRGFKKIDQYHLPDLDASIESMGAPNDPRIMSQAELEEYARQFHSGEDINIYDFSKIDFESPFFLSLPPGDRYNILNAARLRSRLRMGYSKEQLDGMFPDRMAFSRFQIERVKERNELTQRLMHINGMAEDFLNQGGRIAGEKGKEYVLVKNDGVEGGWALGVVSNKSGAKREYAIDLDEEEQLESDDDPSAEEDDFEDVEIEGLNRIPKVWLRKRKEIQEDISQEEVAEEIARKRKSVYEARAHNASRTSKRSVPERQSLLNDTEDLFVHQEKDGGIQSDDEAEELFEDVDLASLNHGSDEDEIQRAIALSLQKPDSNIGSEAGGFIPGIITDEDGHTSGDEELDFQAALAESRKSKYNSRNDTRMSSPKPPSSSSKMPKNFEGPLPFESLNLGQSLLGKKKSKRIEEDLSGGFDRHLGDDAFRKEKPILPMPSWFNAVPKTNDPRNDFGEDQAAERENPLSDRVDNKVNGKQLRRNSTKEVIDVDAEVPTKQIIALDDSSEEGVDGSEVENDEMDTRIDNLPDHMHQLKANEVAQQEKEEQGRNERYRLAQEIADENAEMEEVDEDAFVQSGSAKPAENQSSLHMGLHSISDAKDQIPSGGNDAASVEWSQSEDEDAPPLPFTSTLTSRNLSGSKSEGPASPRASLSKQSDFEDDDDVAYAFEDVDMEFGYLSSRRKEDHSALNAADMNLTSQFLIADGSIENPLGQVKDKDLQPTVADDDYLSDSDEELMRQLAIEAEEHARFASSLNNKTHAQAAHDYENELKQLRSQQKKDRRDADEVTQVMIQECQALLQLFGLPYITAPMEAEAQCAKLVQLGLVDGIVTDDSDVFLFGGTRVYKNMFNAAKFVECYLVADLEREYALDRKKLVRFAHLLGSDYTEGIPGVGPVTALEILSDFQTLEDFKDWCTKVQIGRPQELENQLTTPFRRKFRNTVQKRLFLPPGFPDVRVDQAYLQPEVDSDPQEFQWGVPDLDKLRSFLMATIGWSQDRTDEILVPVIRDMNKRDLEGTQANITRFFTGGVGIGAAKEMDNSRKTNAKESGRMAKAYRRLRGEAEKRKQGESIDVSDSENVSVSVDGMTSTPSRTKTTSKRKAPRRRKKVDDDEGDDENESESRPENVTKKRRNEKMSD